MLCQQTRHSDALLWLRVKGLLDNTTMPVSADLEIRNYNCRILTFLIVAIKMANRAKFAQFSQNVKLLSP